jgi:DNA-directed RNA polymerase subunit RPC12/RpoP
MTHTCENCSRTFATKLTLELHRDTCVADSLVCRRCGGRFPESKATRDGWHYECPDDDCEGTGMGEDLVRPEEVRVGVQ